MALQLDILFGKNRVLMKLFSCVQRFKHGYDEVTSGHCQAGTSVLVDIIHEYLANLRNMVFSLSV